MIVGETAKAFANVGQLTGPERRRGRDTLYDDVRGRTTRAAVSFRLPADLVEELKRRAHESGLPATTLVERYVGEGLRLDGHPLIGFRDGAAGRRAALVGSRLDVAHVIDTFEAAEGRGDDRVAEVAEYLELPVHLVRAAVRYYADHKDEVEAWRRRDRELVERERAAWEREQAVLG